VSAEKVAMTVHAEKVVATAAMVVVMIVHVATARSANPAMTITATHHKTVATIKT
jgi:hypothetical protein